MTHKEAGKAQLTMGVCPVFPIIITYIKWVILYDYVYT